ncbi:uncharacterized protein QC764_0109240 [Podospora pseudoanserina]|uniref:Heme haloperoxidase family profile domain-containing protein n=1 Tax=Podospora pseudoanserina TaxID=2609844 RepID=A0ABR0HI98_9PEZI|nr:hypothetical protein QC764_0109240 [Podospora pseudoanserina]
MSLAFKVITSFSSIFTATYSTIESLISSPNQETNPQQDHAFQAPSPTDKRSPCPMVNALANHAYLPRDGSNVSLLKLIQAAKEGINLAPDATLIVGLKALQTSTTGSWLTFNLDDLNKHGEKTSSLAITTPSPPRLGKQSLNTSEDWRKIPLEVAAKARKERVESARASNPEFNLTDDQNRFSILETCLYLMVFGEGTQGNARTDWVKVLFEEERLPFQEGFKRSSSMLTLGQILELHKKVEAVGGTGLAVKWRKEGREYK